MDITSFYFLCFYAVLLILYYVIPAKGQWMLLLGASVVFYLLGGNGLLILYPLSAVLVTYLSTMGIHTLQEKGKTADKEKKLHYAHGASAVMWVGVLLLLGVLAGLKYVRFNGGIAVPLGLSFYTFSLVGYLLDVYHEIATVQKNPAKVLLYGMYFPTIVSGPILRYREDGAGFYTPHKLDYTNITRGLQRMLWGFFKKLVISERAAVIANTIFADPATYGGAYVWLGALSFTFQLYTDFSGCMDIVIGLSETFGITLPENFKQPFFAKSISEYWRRWHITLGVWMKEYVFYPLLRTSLFAKLSKSLRGKCGKKTGKMLTTFTAMFILWLTVGLWHGGDVKYVIGSGLLHWFYIVMGEVTLPFFKKWFPKWHIPMEGRFADTVRILRTFFLVNIGNIFFRADHAKTAMEMLKQGITVWNPQILWNGAIFDLGLDFVEWGILIVSLGIVLVVSLLQEKGSVREMIAAKPIWFRYLIWFALLFYCILLANYGPGYSSQEFIYAGF